MLTENDMATFSCMIAKLSTEGYDVSSIRDILIQERKKINVAEAADLTAYFPIKDNIQLKLASIKYGMQPLTVNLQLIVERLSGVFDANSKPERFEGILKNAVYNCLKSLKEQYTKEVESLLDKKTTTVKKGTSANPLSFTFGTNNDVLYADSGSIDVAVAWTVQSITDSSSTNLSGGGATTNATSAAPILLALSDGNGTVVNMSCTSGSFSGIDVTTTATAVTIGGGE